MELFYWVDHQRVKIKCESAQFSSPDRRILKIDDATLNTKGGITLHINET